MSGSVVLSRTVALFCCRVVYKMYRKMGKKPENIQSTLTALIGIVSIVSVQNLLLAFECSWLKKMTAAEREGTKSRRVGQTREGEQRRGRERLAVITTLHPVTGAFFPTSFQLLSTIYCKLA